MDNTQAQVGFTVRLDLQKGVFCSFGNSCHPCYCIKLPEGLCCWALSGLGQNKVEMRVWGRHFLIQGCWSTAVAMVSAWAVQAWLSRTAHLRGVRFQGWVCLSSRVLMAWLQLCVRCRWFQGLISMGTPHSGAGSVEWESECVLHENINL